MKCTIYKITNLINNKIYAGCHKTNNLDDGYMGSGVYLKRAQEKYGLENFTKEILEVYDNPEDMFNSESILVNEEFVSRKDTYNLREGGEGGWDHIHKSGKHKDYCSSGGKNGSVITNNLVEEKRKNTEYDKQFRLRQGERFKGQNHSDTAKKKIGEANSVHQKGEGNSQFGTMWIHNINLKQSKRIPKTEEIPEGWLKGRKIKFI